MIPMYAIAREDTSALSAIGPSRQAAQASAGATALPEQVDLAVITAMPEELEHVLNLIGGRQHWERINLNNYTHYYAEFAADGGQAFSVIACSQSKYGGDETVAAVHRLAALRPRLIAMTGICAGREGDVALGDVIVAERAFRAEEGKQTPHEFQPDTQTYQPPSWLVQALKGFPSNDQWHATLKTPRPISLRYQAQWLLCRIASASASYPATDADWQALKTSGIALKRAKQSLIAKGWLSADEVITPKGQQVLQELCLQHDGACQPEPEPQIPKVHYGAFASTVPIIAIQEPFLETSDRVRTVRAIDLEVCSLYSSAAALGIATFAVKGVSDYGTPEKDDAFHEYAAEASARWMYAFVTGNADLLLRSTVLPSEPLRRITRASAPPVSSAQSTETPTAVSATTEAAPLVSQPALGRAGGDYRLTGIIGLIVVLLLIIGFLVEKERLLDMFTAASSQSFSYLVRVEAQDTGKSIPGAKVTLETSSVAPIDEYTDSNGLARMMIDASRAGKPGKLIVEASGYQQYTQDIDLIQNALAHVIQIKRVP